METFFFFVVSYDVFSGLNRTMQYGNFIAYLYIFSPRALFKSYYVVWKPNYLRIFCYKPESLNRTMQYGNCIALVQVACEIQCLNRTMQYGNSRTYRLFEISIACLNRTMQYGNFKILFSNFSISFCLNRTMQYGNQFPFPVHFLHSFV